MSSDVATRNETTVVYAAGVVQGIVLVTFPAASTVFTDPAQYGLSSAQYGTLFLPQVVAAIAASLLGAGLGTRPRFIPTWVTQLSDVDDLRRNSCAQGSSRSRGRP